MKTDIINGRPREKREVNDKGMMSGRTRKKDEGKSGDRKKGK